jgi:predicted ester cyclase
MGVPPTGKKIETGFWDMHRFDEDGRMVQTWNLTDSHVVLRQLGLAT